MDEREELMQQMWETWKPYNRAADDKWRSYVIGNIEAQTLEVDEHCVTIVNATNGMYAM